METGGCDVAVVDSILAAETVPWLGVARRFPIAASIHQPPGGVEPADPARRALDLKAYAKMDLLIVASDSLEAALESDKLGPPIRVVPPGRDVEGSDEYIDDSVRDRRQKEMRRGRGASFLSVANWVPHKGVVELIDALDSVPENLLTLHLVGDTEAHPSYVRKVRRQIERHGLQETVVVHGKVPRHEMAALYAGADVFVAPSFQDAYATAVGEAMAMALPVVGWDAGNLPFLATDGVEGRVLPTGDIKALAGAMSELASDETLRSRLGGAALRRARSRPTWDESAAMFFGALRELID